MSMVLPSTVEEINCMQNSLQSAQPMYIKEVKEDFPFINAGRYKREVSLPNGVQWNVYDFEAYLNFDEPNLVNVEVAQSQDDKLQIVPGDEQRPRSESISSVGSSMDDKSFLYNNMAVKTFNTVCMDSGSTCISSDHSFINIAQTNLLKDLEGEETFQNLHQFINRSPELQHTDDTISSISSAPSPLNDSNLEYSILTNFSTINNSSQDSFSEKPMGYKRSLDEDIYMTSSKRSCESPDDNRYFEIRKKNNAASKNCRKTRKEKMKEMESRVVDLEREREDLKKQIRYLEFMTGQFKAHIAKIMKPLQNV